MEPLLPRRLAAHSPCLECKLCVAACPVGAIAKDGQFDFMACSTHNYREFMGGFTDFVDSGISGRS
jgi:ferredoxin